ncbi:MAG: GrpB family protein [Candidatus Kurthia intestinigallinarum]
MRKINVVPYDEQWPVLFELESQKIKSIVCETYVNILHIGSTSVPKLSAKPVIDILLIVEDLEKLNQLDDDFKQLGYEALGEYGIIGRRFYRKGGDMRTHHIHAFHYSNIVEIERHIAFRDYLRRHPEQSQLYEALKSQLAARFPYDNNAYCDGKNDFIKQLEQQALKWMMAQKT